MRRDLPACRGRGCLLTIHGPSCVAHPVTADERSHVLRAARRPRRTMLQGLRRLEGAEPPRPDPRCPPPRVRLRPRACAGPGLRPRLLSRPGRDRRRTPPRGPHVLPRLRAVGRPLLLDGPVSPVSGVLSAIGVQNTVHFVAGSTVPGLTFVRATSGSRSPW